MGTPSIAKLNSEQLDRPGLFARVLASVPAHTCPERLAAKSPLQVARKVPREASINEGTNGLIGSEIEATS